MIKDAYEEKNGILGYRQITIKLNREHNLNVNHKRIYRLMHILNLRSVCRRKRKNYIKSTPEITAENILNRPNTSEADTTRKVNYSLCYRYPCKVPESVGVGTFVTGLHSFIAS